MSANYPVSAWQKYWFPIVLLSYEVAVYLSNDMYLPALPDLARDLRASPDQVQTTMTAWFLGSCSVSLILGPLVDFIGRKRVLVGGNGLFVLTCILCALATNVHFMMVVRFLQGMCVCVVFIAGYASIHEWFSGKKAVEILAWMGSITILAPSVGTYLGAWIIHIFSWQATFWLLAVWGVVCCAALIYVMPRVPVQKNFSLRPALIAYKNILTTPAFLKFMGTAFCCFIPIFSWLVDGPFIVMETYHRSALVYGLMQAIVFLGYMVGMRITKKMIAIWHIKRLINIGFCVIGLGVVLLFVAANLHLRLEIGIACITVVALGIAMLSGPLNRLSVESCDQPTVQKVALYSNSIGFAAVLASTLVVIICEHHTLLGLAWLFFAAAAIGFGIYWLVPGKVELADEDPKRMNAPEV
jgi:MFS family permease